MCVFYELNKKSEIFDLQTFYFIYDTDKKQLSHLIKGVVLFINKKV